MTLDLAGDARRIGYEHDATTRLAVTPESLHRRCKMLVAVVDHAPDVAQPQGVALGKFLH